MLIGLHSILRPILPISAGNSNSFYFLRRLVTTPHLPPPIRDDVQVLDGFPTIHLLVPPPLPTVPDEIVDAIRPYVQFEHLPSIRTTQIPVDPPSTAQQAALWSEKYWPCTFNPASQTIQKAPPFGILRSIKSELDAPANLDSYFGLAKLAATECRDRALGRGIAAVIVDSLQKEVIAVAGDARWYRQSRDKTVDDIDAQGMADGRPEHHALMRAIAMVARKTARSRSDDDISAKNAADIQATDLGGRPLTHIEDSHSVVTNGDQTHDLPIPQSAGRADAYLCSGLDVYLTHEPCVACSMAMIHSRFRACIFLKRMPRTGGLCAEKVSNGYGGLGYGLFWRKELNWRVLTFQYFPSGCHSDADIRARGTVEEAFHA